jgi:rhodanese-related sulfurtransferase
MPKYTIILILLILPIFMIETVNARCEENTTYPLREVFISINCINTAELIPAISNNEVILIDARTQVEFNILRIKNAINIDIDNKKSFVTKIKKIRMESNKTMVFYCNGKKCNLSYRAGKMAIEQGIHHSVVYDAGIFAIAHKAPEMVLLFGENISENNTPISKQEFKKHLLEPALFEKKIIKYMDNNKPFKILDIRDRSSKQNLSALNFPHEKYIPLSKEKKLNKFLKTIAQKNITLFVYDWAGFKLKWIQYYIKKYNIHDYYFLKGGAVKKINIELKEDGMPPLPF